MTDQIFSTIQIEVGRWRWLPVNCVDGTGNGIGTGGSPPPNDVPVPVGSVYVTYIKYGQLAYTNYVPDDVGTQFKLAASAGDFSFTLNDTSNLPPENGRLSLNPLGGPGVQEFVNYLFNNVTTGEITLDPDVYVTGLSFNHAIGILVDRIDWVEPTGTLPGNYLLLFPPTILDTTDLFTYQVMNGYPPPIHPAVALFEPYQNTVDIVDTGDPGTFLPPSVPTCKFYGFVLGLSGAPIANSAISARLLTVPALLNNAAFNDTVISSKTDANGYFEFSVAQGTTVDIVIPDIGYRRTIVVPSTTLAKLFELS